MSRSKKREVQAYFNTEIEIHSMWDFDRPL